jgi:CHAT domain-containing protein/Tfp pilus assembly protein PilF
MSLTKFHWSFGIVAILIVSTLTLSQEKDEVRTLEPDKPIERELVCGEAHWYQTTLNAGQFLTVVVDQSGIDAMVKLFGPDGRQLSEVDSPNSSRGPEPVSVLAKVSGSYRLEVLAVEKNAPAGHYKIRIDALREATAQDKTVDLAAALAMARTEAEQTTLMPKDKELLTADLERLLFNYGLHSSAMADHQQALTLYRLALGIAERRESKSSMASILNNIGSTLMEEGDYTQALGSYHRSMVLLEELGDKPGIVKMLYNLGAVHAAQGNYDLALEYDRKYLAIVEVLNNKPLIARVMPAIGNIYFARGDYAQAMKYYQNAATMFAELGDKSGIIVALQNIAGIHAQQNNTALALEYYQKALAVAAEASNGLPTAGGSDANEFSARTLLNIGSVYHAQGNYTKALELELKSLEMSEAMKNLPMIATALSNIGQTYFMQGNYAQALESFQRALKINEETGNKVLMAHLLGNIGDAYHAQGNYNEALKFEERAAEMARQLGDPEDLWYARMMSGKSYHALGQNTQARKALEEAITTIENMRTRVAGGEQQQETFFEDKVIPYHAMAELLISQNNPREALLYAERAKARVLLDVLQSGRVKIDKAMTAEQREQEREVVGELDSLNTQVTRESQNSHADQKWLAALQSRLEKARFDYEGFQSGLYVANPQLRTQRGEAQPLKLEEARDLLPDNRSAALEFVVTEDKTYLFVLAKNSERGEPSADLKVYPVAIGYKELSRRVEVFRKQLAQGDLEFQQTARGLYDLLLKPAQTQLQSQTTLVIVPDSVLWNLPFQALQSAANHYLIEDQAVFYAPSLTVLREMIKAHSTRANTSRFRTTLLAFGNPAVSKQTVHQIQRVSMDEKLEPLPEAERQVTALAELYGRSQSKVYTGTEAREDRAKAEAGDFRILQFATHGILNDRSPMYSHLVLSQADGDNKEDGLLEAWEMMNLNLNADMVVLSACETARGRVGAGEGIIGMSWALFVAGAPTTVASQWKVESASTTQLMLEFHHNLQARIQGSSSPMSKARAMQQASIKLLRSARYSHPFYWAGFVVVGDGF